jgi:hypothetical protein
MPRFSDIFVYQSCECEGDLSKYVFMGCYLLKAVGEHAKGTRVDEVEFDVTGMVLFFKMGISLEGPYVLTTPV